MAVKKAGCDHGAVFDVNQYMMWGKTEMFIFQVRQTIYHKS